MHLSSLKNMAAFVERELSHVSDRPITILDLGSTEMGACYRPIFANPNWKYIGADLAAGPNVNLVLQDPYSWKEVKTASIDVLVSGQVLEHIEYFWITALEISRVLRPGGLACLIAPSSGPEHRYPVDCWRFYPDGMKAIGKFARLEVVSVKTDWANSGDPGSDFWHDTVGVFRKPRRTALKAAGVSMLQWAQRRALSARLDLSDQSGA
jgi:SAM-dependent methyltransferase